MAVVVAGEGVVVGVVVAGLGAVVAVVGGVACVVGVTPVVGEEVGVLDPEEPMVTYQLPPISTHCTGDNVLDLVLAAA